MNKIKALEMTVNGYTTKKICKEMHREENELSAVRFSLDELANITDRKDSPIVVKEEVIKSLLHIVNKICSLNDWRQAYHDLTTYNTMIYEIHNMIAEMIPKNDRIEQLLEKYIGDNTDYIQAEQYINEAKMVDEEYEENKKKNGYWIWNELVLHYDECVEDEINYLKNVISALLPEGEYTIDSEKIQELAEQRIRNQFWVKPEYEPENEE